MNQQGNHPTDRQIEEYAADGYDRNRAECAEDIRTHIENCESCQKRVLEEKRIQLGILKQGPGNKRHPSCPPEATLEEYAAGLFSGEGEMQIRQHVASCDFCAPLLKTYTEDFSSELSPEAKDFLDRLPASNPAWQKRFVRKNVVRRPGGFARLKRFFFSFRGPGVAWRSAAMAGALAGLIFVVVALSNIMTSAQVGNADKLIVKAFVENPKTDLRYAWAPATFDIKLSGPGQPVASNLPVLHEAQYMADQKRYSSNPKWLRINGRLALLTGNIKAAIFLKSAYDKGLHDPSTEIDLAAAYFLRDTSPSPQSENAGKNVDETVNLLLKVLKEPNLTPNETAAAMYNLAVAYETMLRWDQAVDVWTQYRALDSNGPWAEEAERRLIEDRKKIPPPMPEGYKTPAFFIDHSSDAATQKSIEQYQDIALRTWFMDLMGGHAAESSRAIQRLADMLEAQHDDSWMKDFLESSHSLGFAGVQDLSAAITSNLRGLHPEAKKHALAAQAIFARYGNRPGLLRSRFESLYSSQRLTNWEDCVNLAQSLGKELRGARYRWLQVQVDLTQAACVNRLGHFEAAYEQRRLGHQNAIRYGFNVLALRAQAFAASMIDLHGCSKNWQNATNGLEMYWRGPSIPKRLYEFYSPMKICLENKKLWYAAEALERRMISILEKEVDPEENNALLEKTAYDNLETILTALDMSAPKPTGNLIDPDPVVARYRLRIQIERAEIQLDHGHAPSALHTLEDAQELVESIQDDLIQLSFYRLSGDVRLKLEQLTDAGAAYKRGLEIAEQAFGQLTDDGNRRQWMKETSEIYRGLVGAFLGQDKKEEALQLWEWYRAHLWALEANRGASTSPISWQEIENDVLRVPISTPELNTRLVYAFIKDCVYVWTVGSRGAKMPPVVKIKQELLQQRISEYWQEISNENSNTITLEEDSKRLFSVLLTPVIAGLPESGTVVVELDPEMKELLLETLKSSEGWYFGQKYPVIYSPGILKENELRPPLQRVFASGWLLNALTVDDRSMIENFKGLKVWNAFSNPAPAQVPELLRESEIFVFFGHGKSGSLLIRNGKPLQASDFPLESLQKLQLAILAACSSGSPNSGLMDDTSGIVRALLSGGVSTVIASRWDVSRDSTDQLTHIFYEHFKKGQAAAHSMLEARQEIFRAGNRHPYYWAAFSINGRAN